MALSVFASVAPLALFRARRRWLATATFGCTLAMLMTYQASSGILPMAAVFVALLDWRRGEDFRSLARKALAMAAPYAAAMAIYYFFFMKHVDVSGYISNGLAAPLDIVDHYRTYYMQVVVDLKAGWLCVAVATAVAFVVLFSMGGERKTFGKVLLAVGALTVSLLLAFGFYPLLEHPLYAPRAMYGAGAMLALVASGCIVAAGEGRRAWLPRALAIVLSWSFAAFALTYGNALSMQAEWEGFRRDDVAEAIASQQSLDGEDGALSARLEGSAGLAPAVQGMSEGCVILQRLVPVTLQENWMWGTYKLQHYYGLDNVTFGTGDGETSLDGFELIEETGYHQLWRKGNELVIRISGDGE